MVKFLKIKKIGIKNPKRRVTLFKKINVEANIVFFNFKKISVSLIASIIK